MSHSTSIFLALLLPSIAPVAAAGPGLDQDATRVTATATIDTTLTTASEQIRQFAFDGVDSTFFASAENATRSDHFTLGFDRPVAMKSIAVVTGRTDGSDGLDQGTLEVSADGKTFVELVRYRRRYPCDQPQGRTIQAIRIKPGADLGHPLVIRELTIASDPPVAIFAYPVEFMVDVSSAPEMKAWAEKAAQECERHYPMINEELKSDGYRPPHFIKLTLKSDYKGVAETAGDRITGSVKFFKAHPDDLGAMIHETVHVVQHYRGRRNNPSWLVEGVADYVRFFKYEPGNLGRIDPDRAHYNRSYRVTAAFLAYLAETYDPQIVRKLNTIMREGHYRTEVFQELTGKTVEELDAQWRATLRP